MRTAVAEDGGPVAYWPVIIGGDVTVARLGYARGLIRGGRSEWHEVARNTDVLVWAPTASARLVDPLLGLRVVWPCRRYLYVRGLDYGRSLLAAAVRAELREANYRMPTWTTRVEAEALARAIVAWRPEAATDQEWLSTLYLGAPREVRITIGERHAAEVVAYGPDEIKAAARAAAAAAGCARPCEAEVWLRGAGGAWVVADHVTID